MTDFTGPLYSLAHADEDGEDRVFTWRKILKEVHDAAFHEGYVAANSDEALRARLREAAAKREEARSDG